ncbi:CpsD/CapB family tyrosine-protein kinase [Salipiger sp. IMCC34102]|uniref:tyrosine-protein kinase family protein n=1 Tax=Salipiger sp. IMCC34102 TaxID=2510647 RepID=UPI0013EBC467|nr:CpsD/CapB family tyrosine-protein kinase [Salipiger sp. IMCC34102]
MLKDSRDTKALVYARPASAADPDATWFNLRRFEPGPARLNRNRIVTQARRDPAAVGIDLLRTRLLNAMEERGWTHLGITSPTGGCGKTFLAANLGFSLARQAHLRTLLCDMDLRNPGLTRALEIPEAGSLASALDNAAILLRRVVRLADNFAVMPNDTVSDSPAETLHATQTRAALGQVMTRLRPDVVIYDLPPALVCDDILAFKYQLDAVVLVSHGEKTTAQQVRNTEALLDGELPILATVLNEAEDASTASYYGG